MLHDIMNAINKQKYKNGKNRNKKNNTPNIFSNLENLKKTDIVKIVFVAIAIFSSLLILSAISFAIASNYVPFISLIIGSIVKFTSLPPSLLLTACLITSSSMLIIPAVLFVVVLTLYISAIRTQQKLVNKAKLELKKLKISYSKEDLNALALVRTPMMNALGIKNFPKSGLEILL